ncbi:MAG: flippase-like domain-containing protein, partial [Candidatus Saganbacteria bacterium]|nr:flippase-like domain-containing protein [Candidatus Saganbacteria bacterium]
MDKLKILFKIVISLVFMGIVLSKINFEALGKDLSHANILLIIVSFILFCLTMIVMVQRWNFLIGIFHNKIPFMDLVSVYWIGLFFSLFLPSAIGGDAVKMYKLSKHHGNPIEVSTSVLMDRIVGLTSLSILSFFSMLIFWNSFDFNIAGKIIGTVAFSLLGFYLLIFNIKFVRRI